MSQNDFFDLTETQQKEIKNYESPKIITKKKLKDREEKWLPSWLEKKSKAEEKAFETEMKALEDEYAYKEELIEYIFFNDEVVFPEFKVISHKRIIDRPVIPKKGIKQLFKNVYSSKAFENEGLLELLLPYPIFPEDNGKQKYHSKDALLVLKENLDDSLADDVFIDYFIDTLGGITKVDKNDLAWSLSFRRDSFSNHQFHEGFYSLNSECNLDIEICTEGVRFRLHYPYYFTVFDFQLKIITNNFWEYKKYLYC